MDELEVIRVRDEVLQAMYWMHSEGMGADTTAEDLARFLAFPAPALSAFLDRFVEDGLLERADGRYRLSPSGADAGKRTFAEEMAELTGSTHGECDEDCWCHQSPEAAASCLEERRGHVHTR